LRVHGMSVLLEEQACVSNRLGQVCVPEPLVFSQAITPPRVWADCGANLTTPTGSGAMQRVLGVDGGLTGEDSHYICPCGNIFLSDAVYCRKCGAKRPPDETLFSRIDTNKDGVISRRELNTAVREGVVSESASTLVQRASNAVGALSIADNTLSRGGLLASTATPTATSLGAVRRSRSPVSPASVRFDFGKTTLSEKGSASLVERSAFSERSAFLEKSSRTGGLRTLGGVVSAASAPLNERTRDLEALAMQRHRSFGSLETSWLIKNCFAVWRSLIRIKANFAIQRDEETVAVVSTELEALRELQLALAGKDELILYLEQRVEHLTAELEACQERLRVEVSRLEGHHTTFIEDIRAQHGNSYEELRGQHSIVLDELQGKHSLALEELTEQHNTRVDVLVSELEELRRSHAGELDVLRLELDVKNREHGQERGRLEEEWQNRLREAEERHAAREESWRLQGKEAQMLHARVEEEWRLKLGQNSDELMDLAKGRAASAAMALLGGKSKGFVAMVFAAWARVVQRLGFERELDDHRRGAAEERERMQSELTVHMDRTEAERVHLEAERDLHIRAIEEERAEKLREMANAHAGIHEDLTMRLRAAEDERDLHVQRIEEERIVAVRTQANAAAFALMGGKSKAVVSVTFNAWVRHAKMARVEMEWEAKHAALEEKHRQLEQDFEGRLRQAEAHRNRVEGDWQVKLRKADQERTEVLREMEANAQSAVTIRAQQAAMALMGGKSTAVLAAVLHGWARAVERERLEQELELRLREADAHKQQMQAEHDRQLQKERDTIEHLEQDRDMQLRQMEDDAHRKMRSVEEQYGELEQNWGGRLKKVVEENDEVLKAAEAERDRLLKESKALAMLTRSQVADASNAVLDKHQVRMLLFQVFNAWEKMCMHTRWTAHVEDLHKDASHAFDKICSRRELASEGLAKKNQERMMKFEGFKAWLELCAHGKWKGAMEAHLKHQEGMHKGKRTEMVMFAVSKGSRRLVLAQVFLAWLHAIRWEGELNHAADKHSRDKLVHSDKSKNWGYKMAFMTEAAEAEMLLHKVLSAWWLHQRESKWGSHQARFRSREDQLIAKMLLRSGLESAEQLLNIAFGVWKSSTAELRSLEHAKTQREKLLDRWGMQSGLTKGQVFWHRIFNRWHHVASQGGERRKQEAVRRAHVMRVAERLCGKEISVKSWFYEWLGNTSHGKSRRTVDELSKEVAQLRMKHGTSRDRSGGFMTVLHLRGLMHSVLSQWGKVAYRNAYERNLGLQGTEIERLRRDRNAHNNRMVLKVWGSQGTLLLRVVVTAWRQHIVDSGSSRRTDHLKGVITALRGVALNRFQQPPRVLLHRLVQLWRHVVLESKRDMRHRQLKDTNWNLAQEMQNNILYRQTFLAQGVFTRWKHHVAESRHLGAIEETMRRAALERQRWGSGAPGRVLAVVSAIEDQRLRMTKWQALMVWAHAARLARAAQGRGIQIVQFRRPGPVPVPVSRVSTVASPRTTAVPVSCVPAPRTVSYTLDAPKMRLPQSTQVPAALGWRVVNAGLDQAQKVKLQGNYLEAWRSLLGASSGGSGGAATPLTMSPRGTASWKGQPRVAAIKIGPAMSVCPQCGNTYAPDARFCRKCGAKRIESIGLAEAAASPRVSEVCTTPTWSRSATSPRRGGNTPPTPAAPPMFALPRAGGGAAEWGGGAAEWGGTLGCPAPGALAGRGATTTTAFVAAAPLPAPAPTLQTTPSFVLQSPSVDPDTPCMSPRGRAGALVASAAAMANGSAAGSVRHASMLVQPALGGGAPAAIATALTSPLALVAPAPTTTTARVEAPPTPRSTGRVQFSALPAPTSVSGALASGLRLHTSGAGWMSSCALNTVDRSPREVVISPRLRSR